jgi:hypothetical protein
MNYEFGQNDAGVDHQCWKSNSDFHEDNPLQMEVIPFEKPIFQMEI